MLGIRISEEFAESERNALPDAEFARERLGIWPPEASGEWQVISEDAWTATRVLGLERPTGVVFAVDMTPDRGTVSIAVAGTREDGLIQIEVVEHRDGTGWVV